MKKYLLIGAIIILIIITIYLLTNRKKITISDIKSFHFNYSVGTAMDAYATYELKCSDKCIATIKPPNISEENKKEIEIDKKTLIKIESILKKYEVEKWNGFNKNDKNVLDGNSFSLYITMKNNDYISATGYMRWPKNYQNFKNEINDIFLKIYNK